MVIPVTLLVGSYIRKVSTGCCSPVPPQSSDALGSLLSQIIGLFFIIWVVFPEHFLMTESSEGAALFPELLFQIQTWRTLESTAEFFPPKVQCNKTDFLEVNIGFSLGFVNVVASAFSAFLIFFFLEVFLERNENFLVKNICRVAGTKSSSFRVCFTLWGMCSVGHSGSGAWTTWWPHLEQCPTLALFL